jgi:hypothetical protein
MMKKRSSHFAKSVAKKNVSTNSALSLSVEYRVSVCAASYLGKKGYTIPKDILSKEDLDFLHADLFMIPKQMGPQYGPASDDSVSFPVYRENDKKIYVPRFYGIARYGLPTRSEIVSGVDINVPFTKDLRDYQDKIVSIYMDHVSPSDSDGGISPCSGGAILEVPCGRGKCLGKDTPVMMYDGTIRVVQDVQIDDVIMGDDSTPRRIMSIARGRETMYRIWIKDRDLHPFPFYDVNESHILSLKWEYSTVDISVKDYLTLSKSDKENLRGYRVPIQFNTYCDANEIVSDNIPKFDYYHIGKVAAHQGNAFHRLTKTNKPCNQLALLAGIIDARGVAKEDSRYVVKLCKDDWTFASDLRFIARSLGYVINELTSNPYPPLENQNHILEEFEEEEYDEEEKSFGPRRPQEYTYIEICSTDFRSIDEIPCLKWIPIVESNVDPYKHYKSLTYPIHVEELEEDDYYGFEIDGNRRFVLGDFTVTHNTVMALKIASLVQKKTLIIVHKEFLMNQWIERAQEFVPSARIGKIQGPLFDIEEKDIVLGMLQTLYDRDFPEAAFDSFGLTIIDEVHRIGSQQFSKALLRIVSPCMLGISATVDRKDGLSKVLHMFIGEKIYTEKREDEDPVCVRGIEYISADPKFNEMEYDFRGNPKYSTMISKISEFGPRSDFIVRVLQDLIQENPEGQIMVLCHNRSLLTYFYMAIQHRGFATCGYYVGGMKQADLQETESKQIVLATYAMAAEALDIKTLSILVMASPKTDITQSVGRILRVRHDNPIIVDIIDKHEIFQNQWRQRKSFYRKCNYRILTTDSVRYRPALDPASWTTSFEPKSKKSGGIQTVTDQEDTKSKCLISFESLDLERDA